MSKEEAKVKIEKLEMQRFYLAMKDNWSHADYEKDEEIKNEIKKLKKI